MRLKPSAEFSQIYTGANLGLLALVDKVLAFPSPIALILYVFIILIVVARSINKDPGV
jgi:4-hydroxybenzoate polyprenyltransferase